MSAHRGAVAVALPDPSREGIPTLEKGHYRLREALGPVDLQRAQALRAQSFGLALAQDADAFDALCLHALIEDRRDGALVGCFRLFPCDGETLQASYSAQFYGLSRLRSFEGGMLELGRFCVDPARADPDILRLAWAALTAFVDAHGIAMLFGCSSFPGTDPAPHLAALGVLRARHLAPEVLRPDVLAPEIFAYGDLLTDRPDGPRAVQQMPPLLKTYLLMGGWVSDHAVIDRQMNTLHVFTGLEVSRIPESRKRLLRAMV